MSRAAANGIRRDLDILANESEMKSAGMRVENIRKPFYTTFISDDVS